nr:hypothetical protein [Nanoarchaeum sp.]
MIYSLNEPEFNNYLRTIDSYPILSKLEEIELGRLIKINNDQEARDKLINSNLRFVVSIARKYANLGISLSDLVNQGNVGLIKALERYDYQRENRFFAFASHSVTEEIVEAICEQTKLIHLPIELLKTFVKIKKYCDTQMKTKGTHPSESEIQSLFFSNSRYPEERLRLYHQYFSGNNLRLDDKILRTNPALRTSGFNFIDPYSTINQELEIFLDDREREIIKLHYDEDLSLETIGTQIGYSHEGVRRIRNKALAKLKDSKVLEDLHELQI